MAVNVVTINRTLIFKMLFSMLTNKVEIIMTTQRPIFTQWFGCLVMISVIKRNLSFAY